MRRGTRPKSMSARHRSRSRSRHMKDLTQLALYHILRGIKERRSPSIERVTAPSNRKPRNHTTCRSPAPENMRCVSRQSLARWTHQGNSHEEDSRACHRDHHDRCRKRLCVVRHRSTHRRVLGRRRPVIAFPPSRASVSAVAVRFGRHHLSASVWWSACWLGCDAAGGVWSSSPACCCSSVASSSLAFPLSLSSGGLTGEPSLS